MSLVLALALARCCPHHDDWQTLASHLVLDFATVSARNVVAELAQARGAVEQFGMDDIDALACAELIVRNRLELAAGLGRHRRSCSSDPNEQVDTNNFCLIGSERRQPMWG